MSDSKQSKLEQLQLEREDINRKLEELRKLDESKKKDEKKNVIEHTINYIKDLIWRPTVICYTVFIPQKELLENRLKELDRQEKKLLQTKSESDK